MLKVEVKFMLNLATHKSRKEKESHRSMLERRRNYLQLEIYQFLSDPWGRLVRFFKDSPK